jgi:hypothetical protein
MAGEQDVEADGGGMMLGNWFALEDCGFCKL